MRAVRTIFTVLLFSAVIFGSVHAGEPQWLTNFDEAQSQAKKSGKPVLLYFSGSDWCRPCMRLKANVFETDGFVKFAAEKLVTVQFDFPARSKNALSKEQLAHNEAMAEKFNPDGVFPLVVLLNSDGTELISVSGYGGESPEDYINRLKSSLDKK
jgi:thioredoxin-related protein